MAGEWQEVSLAEVCREVRYGYTASATDTPTGTRFLRVTDIAKASVDWNTVPFCEINSEDLERYRLETGDIVIARMGTIGVSALIREPTRAVCASYLIRHRIDDARADAQFVAYVLRSPSYWGFVWSHGGGGAVQPNINARVLGDFRFHLPPLTEQRAIAHILGTLDDKIELNRQMSETLEAMARALFKSWFVDFDPVRAKMEGRWKPGQSLPGMPARLYDLFPDRLVDSELGEIPEGWEVGCFGDVVEHLREKENPLDSPTTAFHHFSIPAFDEGQWPKVDLGEAIKSQKSRVPPGVILLSKLNPEIERVWLVDVQPNARAVCSTEFLVLRPRPPAGRAFVYCLSRSPVFRQEIEGLVTGTSKSHQRAHASAILGLAVVRPPTALVDAFERSSEPMQARTLACRRGSGTLAALRDALLPKLISGELRVKDAERFVTEAAA